MEAKLALIRRLSPEELPHWHACVTGRSPLYSREPFYGEIDALKRRAKELDVKLT